MKLSTFLIYLLLEFNIVVALYKYTTILNQKEILLNYGLVINLQNGIIDLEKLKTTSTVTMIRLLHLKVFNTLFSRVSNIYILFSRILF